MFVFLFFCKDYVGIWASWVSPAGLLPTWASLACPDCPCATWATLASPDCPSGTWANLASPVYPLATWASLANPDGPTGTRASLASPDCLASQTTHAYVVNVGSHTPGYLHHGMFHPHVFSFPEMSTYLGHSAPIQILAEPCAGTNIGCMS